MNSSIERVEWPIVQSLSWLCSIAVRVRGNSREGTSPRDEYGRLPLGDSHFQPQASFYRMNKMRYSSKVLDMHKLSEYKPPIPRVFDSAPRGALSNYAPRLRHRFLLVGRDAAFAPGGSSVGTNILSSYRR